MTEAAIAVSFKPGYKSVSCIIKKNASLHVETLDDCALPDREHVRSGVINYDQMILWPAVGMQDNVTKSAHSFTIIRWK